MQYRIDKKTGNKLSVLGFGSYRFPVKFAKTDMSKTEPMVLKAIENGVNYFDTGYFYFGSEEALGSILKNHNLREKVYVATKMPLVLLKRPEDFDKYFNIQLEHLGGYVDYYLVHMLSDVDAWKKLQSWGFEEWIKDKKEKGLIRSGAGFSFHGRQPEFLNLLDEYDWDFVQIQYNYSDENFQAGVTGLKKAASKGISVMIMEPLLGGKLAGGLPKSAQAILKNADPKRSFAEWGYQWVWNQPEVTVTLSGMNKMSDLDDNLQAAEKSHVGMLDDTELAVYKQVQDKFRESYKVLCTGCNYCMPCPKGVNIPSCIATYNMSYTIGRLHGIQHYIFSNVVKDSKELAGASVCVKCGQCEKKCSQNLPVIKILEDVKKRLEPWWIRGPLDFFGGIFKKSM
ncbi:MAG: aldo/keto reductase [Termitinemataceae bacterium]|nr:MAG: aldo/keto reductase [Termitinemataceae bacterium]